MALHPLSCVGVAIKKQRGDKPTQCQAGGREPQACLVAQGQGWGVGTTAMSRDVVEKWDISGGIHELWGEAELKSCTTTRAMVT